MQLKDPLTVAFQHNLWANLTLLEACRELSEEQLARDLLGTYGSIRDTLEHIVRGEMSYFSRISTGKRKTFPADAPPMTIPEMIEHTRQTGEGLVAWARKVSAEESVEINWDGELRQVPKSIILTQALDHGTDHRSQIKTILTQIGIEPPELQSWDYFDQLYLTEKESPEQGRKD